MSAKGSLKELAARSAAPAPATTEATAESIDPGRSYRTAQTRQDTRQVSGHFNPEVAQTLRLIAAEQNKDVQEVLAEALNMAFTRYGKAVRAEVKSGRRKKTETN
ncbi:ribbon-helix-helix domain-containing protein [Acidisoma sp. S159]|uniref:ribbon-helix-helix domain-containing protein n=1 Tax=Acidisoma sp. S159 TaxID=1747225 RepID=UPI00131CEA78|nr:ribbon-helix-helix domain-containing protein [Acidisoma sp. S159]